jgi:hypothetical protein
MLPTDLTARIWDCLIVEGDAFLWRVAAGLIVCLRRVICDPLLDGPPILEMLLGPRILVRGSQVRRIRGESADPQRRSRSTATSFSRTDGTADSFAEAVDGALDDCDDVSDVSDLRGHLTSGWPSKRLLPSQAERDAAITRLLESLPTKDNPLEADIVIHTLHHCAWDDVKFQAMAAEEFDSAASRAPSQRSLGRGSPQRSIIDSLSRQQSLQSAASSNGSAHPSSGPLGWLFGWS